MAVLRGEPTAWPYLILATLSAYVAFGVLTTVYAYWRRAHSPLRRLPGPKGGNVLFGHMRELLASESMGAMFKWAGEHGDTFAMRGVAGAYQLVTADTRALTHILFASNVFQKSEGRRKQINTLVGQGLLFTEGERHRDQRRIMNPAFGHAQVRDLTPLFHETSAQLCDIWGELCVAAANGTARLDVFEWLSKATLDIIGKAGFDYEFGALNGQKNEIAEAFESVIRTNMTPWTQAMLLINESIPRLGAILPNPMRKAMTEGRKTMDKITTRIVEEKKQEILAELGGSGRVEKKAVVGKDLLSLLMRANLAADVEPSQRLTDHEVLDQIPTFLIAGHETTSNQTTWALYQLANHPDIQAKLRAELLEMGTGTPSLDDLNALAYLDHVTRESLRLDGAVAFLTREVFEDDIIPLGAPVKDAAGESISQIKVQKGDGVLIPVRLVNHSKAIWGPDAEEFKPERWERIPAAASGVPGISPALMSFIGGPRSCIGHRFATAEIKALLFHIIRRFEVRLAVEPAEIWAKTSSVLRPQLRSDNSFQMPMLLTPVA